MNGNSKTKVSTSAGNMGGANRVPVRPSDVADGGGLAGGGKVDATSNVAEIENGNAVDSTDNLPSVANSATRNGGGFDSDSGKVEDADGSLNVPHVADENLPHVAEKEAVKNVLPFATRGNSQKRKVPVKTKNKSATRGKSSPVVEAGKGSKGTWQIRLRWNSEKGRPVAYVATVTDAVYDLIRKGDYEAYKRQTIASYEARTVSARHSA